MFDLLLGILIGAVIMDVLWAWRLGYVNSIWQYLRMKYKLLRARFL